ncbi:MAG: hypothetical protein M3R15_21775 [Acidobacteriota bacterium]|nr:hypothetical protein [Acidobacteriota bacterium]
MEAINKKVIASVALVEARISEDELAVCEAALSYVIDTLSATEIERRFGATVDEIEGIRDDVQAILTQHGTTQRTPEPIGR